jgi:large conductance mechanosensitive channel
MGINMLEEFRNFAFKGNAFDLAVGVIMGGAFGKIVDSIVSDLIMPVIGAATGGIDFSNIFLGLNSNVTAPTLAAAREQGATLAYGNFITILINFLILAFILLQMVKFSNRLKKAEPPTPPPAASTSEVLLKEIRDALIDSKAPAAAKKK